ncbi:flagellar brake protein [Photobacterium sp. TY1-4]|uniref:flagellar brake protein n=1 Tax=Photobacterium sp. TY1-4 TaxID=2899122 RepID=UPI0021BEC3A8|nr:flagellar brake protein [Photobacterium sp. TY1-4]UXI02766.1 flagellar brake protein [Photobacterium sp. TY1-4]
MSITDNLLKKRLLASREREKTVTGLQGIAMMNHGSEVTFSIKTPLGRLLRAETTFIGSNGKDNIILEYPVVSPQASMDYFHEGFWVTIKAISEKGEGAQISFKTQIAHIVEKPVRFLILDLPRSMDLLQLRSEARYEVQLQGQILLGQRALLVDFKDLSKNGCCFRYDMNGPQFDEGHKLTVSIKNPNTLKIYHLSGHIKSIHRSGGANNCGILFDEYGLEQVKTLLAQLIFDGAKLSFKS